MLIDFEIPTRLECQLQEINRLVRSASDEILPDPAPLERIYGLSDAGKIRSAMCLLIGGALGIDTSPLIPSTASLEVLCIASQMHTGLQKGTDAQKKLKSDAVPPSAVHSVLAGDVLFASASILAAQCGSVQAMRLIARVLMQITSSAMSQILTEEKSTGKKTCLENAWNGTVVFFEAAAQAPALFSATELGLTARLRNFGRSFGMAYHILEVNQQFKQARSATAALELSGGMEAAGYIKQANQILCHLPACPERDDLQRMLQSLVQKAPPHPDADFLCVGRDKIVYSIEAACLPAIMPNTIAGPMVDPGPG